MWSALQGRLFLSLLATCVLCLPARAETRTFDNDALDLDWFNPMNWDPDGGPATSDALIVNDGVPTTGVLVEASNGGSVLLDGATAGAGLGDLQPGRSGAGSITVQGGADLTTSGFVRIGWFDGSSGEMLVTGDGTTWVADTLVTVGMGFNSTAVTSGSLTISDQADFDGLGIEVGGRPNAEGTLTVDNGAATVSGSISVGAFGVATVDVINGGVLETTGGAINIGSGSSGDGEMYVNGGVVASASGMNIGSFGVGLLDISNGGMVHAGDNTVSVAASVDSSGELFVDGEGSTFTVNSGIQVGNRDIGYVEVTGGAGVTSTSTFFGVFGEFADGWGWIDGPGSTWTTTGQTGIGYESVGLLEITDGGLFSGIQTLIGDQSAGDGELYVYDGGMYDGADILYVGMRGLGALSIETAGKVENDGRGAIGVSSGSEGDAFISDPGSVWDVNNELLVGWSGVGYMTVVDGGVVNSDTGIIAQGIGSFGDVVVAGPDAQWNNTNDLTVGSLGDGIMLVTEGGAVTSVNGLIAASTDATGSVLVGDLVPDDTPNAAGAWDLSGSLYVGGPAFGAGGPGDLTISTDGEVRVADDTVVWSTGELYLDGGLLETGALDVSAGAFSFTAGTLTADTVTGDVVNEGGTVAPGASPGTTTISGDYTQLTDAALEIELGGLTPGTGHDQLIVDGAMINLAGTLDLVHLSGYGMSVGDVFDVVTFTGALAGVFETVTTSSQDGLLYDVEVTYGEGVITVEVLTIVATLPGDANGDGQVDILDLDILSGNFGTTVGATLAEGDFNGDGAVDILDLDILSSNFGAMASGSATIPEPTTLALALTAAVVTAARRRVRW